MVRNALLRQMSSTTTHTHTHTCSQKMDERTTNIQFFSVMIYPKECEHGSLIGAQKIARTF